MVQLVMQIPVAFPDWLRRYTAHNLVLRDILGDYRAGCHHRSAVNVNPYKISARTPMKTSSWITVCARRPRIQGSEGHVSRQQTSLLRTLTLFQSLKHLYHPALHPD